MKALIVILFILAGCGQVGSDVNQPQAPAVNPSNCAQNADVLFRLAVCEMQRDQCLDGEE
jgi:hypothetical protein